jgi:hypothetical protein
MNIDDNVLTRLQSGTKSSHILEAETNFNFSMCMKKFKFFNLNFEAEIYLQEHINVRTMKEIIQNKFKENVCNIWNIFETVNGFITD